MPSKKVGEWLGEYLRRFPKINWRERAGIFLSEKELEGLLSAADLAYSKSILELERRIAELEETLRSGGTAGTSSHVLSANGLAGAIQGTLDTLHVQLSENKNPLSQFLIRDFSIEMPVALSANQLGDLDYRIFNPDADKEVDGFSKIKISIVPIQRTTGNLGRYQTANRSLSEIAELSSAIGTKVSPLEFLSSNGVRTSKEFLAAAGKAVFDAKFTAATGIEKERLLAWLRQCDLLQIDSMPSRIAGILSRTDFSTAYKLAQANASDVAKVLAREKILEDQIQEWIETARAIVGSE